MPTYREKFYKKHKIARDISLSMFEISKYSGVPMDILKEVFARGVGAWKTNIASVRIKGTFEKNYDLKKYPRSARLTAEQWGYARIYSFVMRGKTFSTADADLARKLKK